MENFSTRKPKTVTSSIRDQEDFSIGNEMLNISSGLSQSPVVVVAQSSYNRTHDDDNEYKSHYGSHGSNYPLYSTALVVTIGVGCTLLLLNILVFVAMYYRDKTNRQRHHHNCRKRKHHHEQCDSLCSISNSSLGDTPDICSKSCNKPPVENGGIMSNYVTGK